MAELRSFIFLSRLQPQTMCYLGTWIRGDYTISDVTLNRFFAFHVAAVVESLDAVRNRNVA